MDATVVVCTWNRAARLEKALLSIAAMRVPPEVSWEVLVVDNNSSDSTRAVVEKFVARDPARFRYLFEGRQGKSFALNLGVASARGSVLVFTDDDVTVSPDWLFEALQTFKEFGCGAVGGRIIAQWEAERPAWLITEGPHSLMAAIVQFEFGEQPREIADPPFGANLAVRRELFERYGGFRTDVGPTSDRKIGGEDTEICRRFRAAGESIFYAPRAVVYHPVEPERTRKDYFLGWYYNYGRAQVRLRRTGTAPVSYFGVPRYLLRQLAGHAFSWCFTPDSLRRFQSKLETWRTLGEIAESWKRRSASAVPPS